MPSPQVEEYVFPGLASNGVRGPGRAGGGGEGQERERRQENLPFLVVS